MTLRVDNKALSWTKKLKQMAKTQFVFKKHVTPYLKVSSQCGYVVRACMYKLEN